MRGTTRWLILTGLFAALTAAGAFVRIPLGIASITLQTLFTALAGLVLGPKWGSLSQAAYVALGLIGLPVFTLGGGPAYLLQPSCGFLLALAPTAWLIGRLAHGSADPRRVIPACLAGEVLLYALALPYMELILTLCLGRDMPVKELLWTGMLLYLPGDGLKILLVTLLAPPLTRALARYQG